jgi:hypothetical protein
MVTCTRGVSMAMPCWKIDHGCIPDDLTSQKQRGVGKIVSSLISPWLDACAHYLANSVQPTSKLAMGMYNMTTLVLEVSHDCSSYYQT